MNSSPPPPSFTLPPLTSKGKLPVTPSPTPSPHEGTFDFRIKASKGKGKERAQDASEVEEDVGRVSMYVRLFEGKPPEERTLELLTPLLISRNDRNGAGIGIVPLLSARNLGTQAYHRSCLYVSLASLAHPR